MSLLIQRCRFGNYWRYAKLAKSARVDELRVPRANLGDSRRLCNARTNLNVRDDRIRRYLDYLADRHKNGVWTDKDSLHELVDFNVTGSLFSERAELTENIKNLQDLAKQDTEMKKLAEEEEALYREQLDELDERLLDTILTNMCRECYDNVIVEIVAGVGGQEAMLFVKDLYEMYIGYAKYLSLAYEILELDVTDANGVRNASIMLSGERISKFRYEGGVHRVQRIPATEKSGRIHTSTASVAVLPAPSEVQIQINDKDLKIETKRASGAGGQHVNTTDSAVRITHLPTGLCVQCQVHRSQIKNRQMAMMRLRSQLYEQQLSKQTSFVNELRRKQMGMGMRNEKIRTYNYNQDRVTDHRLQNGTLYNLKEFMQGGVALEELENKLHRDIQMKTLLEVVRKIETQLN